MLRALASLVGGLTGGLTGSLGGGSIAALAFAAGVASSGAVTIAGMRIWDVLVDDPAVAAAARKDYVAVSELEAAKADAELLRKLTEQRARQMAKLQAERQADADALARFEAELLTAQSTRETMQDEIDRLLAARPDGVPSVHDLGVRLRN